MIAKVDAGMLVRKTQKTSSSPISIQLFFLGGDNGVDPQAFASSLGSIVDVTEVQVRQDGKTYLSGSSAIPLHTDHPTISKILWYCHSQDELDGASILSDGWSAYSLLCRQHRLELRGLQLRCPRLTGLTPASLHPFVDEEAEKVFFAPWLLPNDISSFAKNALAAFISNLRNKAAGYTECRLAPGEALLIDNSRILHGRRSIDARSPRHLTRYWVQTGNAA